MARVNYERKTASASDLDFRLDTIRQILADLGDPHHQLKTIHIAGTKGKGSTASFVSQIGSWLGLKTAIYSSPHFERYTERFRIDNSEVCESTLAPYLTRVLDLAESLDEEIAAGRSNLKPATFFDISTATAFLLFADHEVELLALEVGLGGRLDSTNVCRSDVSIVTNISLDHTRQLGSSTVKIAAEKAGIIKPNVPVVCGPVNDSVFDVIKQKADSSSTTIIRYGHDFGPVDSSTRFEESRFQFDYQEAFSDFVLEQIELNGFAEHQVANACLAIAAINQFARKSLDASPKDVANAVREGVSKTQLAGRLELVSSDPLVVADMAHNEASIGAMNDSLSRISRGGKRQVIFSCSRDKDYRSMLCLLDSFFDRIILTEFHSNPRFCQTSTLQEELKSLRNESGNVENLSTEVISIEDPESAYRHAIADAAEYEMTVVCGSIFLVGELLPVMRTDPNHLSHGSESR